MNKTWGHQTNFRLWEQKLTLPPYILRILQYKMLWSVLLKSGINKLKVLFLFHRLLYNLLEKRIKNGGHQTNFRSREQKLPLPPHILRIIQYKNAMVCTFCHLYQIVFLVGSNSLL